MSRTITVVFKHQLGVERVKQLVDEQFASLKAAYVEKIGNAELTWAGDTADIQILVLGQKASGEVAVAEHDATVMIQLPWLLAGLSGTIESLLRNHVDAIDAKPPATQQQPPATGAPH